MTFYRSFGEKLRGEDGGFLNPPQDCGSQPRGIAGGIFAPD
jgi:hypothetical protein